MKLSRYNVLTPTADGDVLFNGISGAVLELDADQHKRLRRLLAGDETDAPVELLSEMIRRRMLVPDDCDELDHLRKRYETTGHRRDQLTVTIVTSLGCNFDCPYCFEAKHPSLLAPRVEEAILTFIDEKLPYLTRLHIVWFGGEPLVGKRALLSLSDSLIRRCDAAGVTYEASIITNGYLLDAPLSRALAARRVRSVEVSLDGPPSVHDRRRPLANGRGSFARILENLHQAVEHLDVSVRINVDRDNQSTLSELLELLAGDGLAQRVALSLGHIVAVDDGAYAPSARYGADRCLTRREFAELRLEFAALAKANGFAAPVLPRPTGAPCVAVRANDLIVGSRGELYKCPESIGNSNEVIGTIFDVQRNGRLRKWLAYDPFADAECRACIALPVCMGGCAHHAMDPNLNANRCDSFRWTYREQVRQYAAQRKHLYPSTP